MKKEDPDNKQPEYTRYSEDEEQVLDLNELTSDIRHSADHNPVTEVLSGARGGRAYSFTRGAILTHVMTHGMHHRAQCLNMLRQLAVEPLPSSSVASMCGSR